jgi:hypothetical protein
MPACGWEVLGCDNCSAYVGLDPAVRAEVDAWAVERLWQWTNQRFGPCEEVVRPCRKSCAGFSVGHLPWDRSFPYIGLSCGICGDNCSCREVQQVKLPGPVTEPLEVIIDGVIIDLSAFRVDDWTILVREDGGHFPACQDMGKPLGEAGTWGVTYLLGEEVPAGGSLVAGILACEYAKALCGAEDCRLPRRVSSIQRQGLVIGILDNFSNLERGFTGIFEIDDWIMAQVKPRRRATISSPDVARPRITTWTHADS